jgi:hypothetical protein
VTLFSTITWSEFKLFSAAVGNGKAENVSDTDIAIWQLSFFGVATRFVSAGCLSNINLNTSLRTKYPPLSLGDGLGREVRANGESYIVFEWN